MMKKNKTTLTTQHLLGGEFVKAFQILKTFRLGLTKDEQRLLTITAEYLSGNGRLYEQMGVDIEQVMQDACNVVNVRWLSAENKTIQANKKVFSLHNQ